MNLLNNLFFVESFFATLFFILALRPLAIKVGHIDQPNTRKQHIGEIPLIGGICIFLSFLSLNYWLPNDYTSFIIAASMIVICGTVDDKRPLSPMLRILIESIAVLCIIFWDNITIKNLGDIFGLGEINLGIFATPFTVFAVIGGINAFNMLDGIDGLAGILSLQVFILLFFVSFDSLQIQNLCLIFIPAISAFLLFNLRIFGRKKASVFLGDTGSMLFGFTICYIIIGASQNVGSGKILSPVTVLWLISLPLFDSVAIMLRRLKKGKSPFSPDREHFHHILLLAGYSVNQTVGIISSVAFVIALFGILGDLWLSIPEWIMFYLFLSLFYLYYWGMTHAWKTMKLARYLREQNKDRRKISRRKNDLPYIGMNKRALAERRSGKDRRYHDIQVEIENDRRRHSLANIISS